VSTTTVAIVEISNCPTRFHSFNHKAEELRIIYKFMLEIAEKIEADEIYFKARQPTVH
jgi:hypothetical protein